jgi:hypothetical protein
MRLAAYARLVKARTFRLAVAVAALALVAVTVVGAGVEPFVAAWRA